MKKIILDEVTRHITMYTRGSYKKDNTMSDIKKIIANTTWISEQYIDDSLIVRHMMSTFWILSETEPLKARTFLTDSLSNHFSTTGKQEMSPEELVEYLADFISTVQVSTKRGRKLIELGSPDYSIMPPNPKRFYF